MGSPPDEFDWGPPKDRPDHWPDDPEVRRFMEWLRSLIPGADWEQRRLSQARRLHRMPHRSRADAPDLPLAYGDPEDLGAWYLFLAEAYVDHLRDYDPSQGSRVIPYFKVLGQYFDLLMTVEGVEERARRMLTTERKQPDGALFELVIALAYRRDGYSVVRFIDEQRGGPKTPDLQAFSPEGIWSIECKRVGRSQYARDERDRFWRLWNQAMPLLEASVPNTLFDLDFRSELSDVPDWYIVRLVEKAQKSTQSFAVDDEWAKGSVQPINLEPLRKVLRNEVVLSASPRLFELLLGRFDLDRTYAIVMKAEQWHQNRRYIDSVDGACVARWRCSAPASVEAKARYFISQIAHANEQLRAFGPGVVHLGIDVLEGSEIEFVRRPRVLRSITNFDPGDTELRWIYLHYFSYEAPPDMAWAINETMETFSIRRERAGKPLRGRYIVLPTDAEVVRHPWQSE